MNTKRKAPWKVLTQEIAGFHGIQDADGYYLAQLIYTGQDENEVAALIAAAPELLGNMKAFVEQTCCSQDYWNNLPLQTRGWCIRFKDLIAKIEGR